MKPIAPCAGQPSFKRTALPSLAARMRRLGITSGVDMLLRGYVDKIRGPSFFPTKIL